MYETQVFGIRLPDQPYTWYCSIMGNYGEHFSYCFYKGERGLFTYAALQAVDNLGTSDTLYFQKAMLLKQEAIQITFEDQKHMKPPALQQIKALGLKYSGPKQWINIEDWSEGLCTWPIEATMAPIVCDLLEQAMRVAAEQRENSKYIGYWMESGRMMPIFIAEKTAEGLSWTKKRQKVVVPDDIDEPIKPQLDWGALRQLPTKRKALLFGILLTFQQVAPENDPDGRPYYPTIYTLINAETEQIVGIFIDERDKPQVLQQQILSAFKTLKYRPEILLFGEPVSFVGIGPLMEAAGIKSVLQPGLMPILDSISEYIAGSMQ